MSYSISRVIAAGAALLWAAAAPAGPAAPATAPTAHAAPADDRTVGRGALLEATRNLHNGWLSGDTAVVAGLLATPYVLTDSRGRVHDRAAVLAKLARADVDLESSESSLSELHVTLAGGAGIVTGISQDRLHYAGRNEERVRRFTEVWVANPATGGWQLYATHESGADGSRISHSAPDGVRSR